MKTYWKKKWLKALRSGKYKQGRRALKTARGNYCCLGVLCDVVAKSSTGKKSGLKWTKRKGEREYRFDENPSFLPHSVMDITGLDSEDGCYESEFDQNPDYLTNLNDNKRKNFKFIADIIEKYF